METKNGITVTDDTITPAPAAEKIRKCFELFKQQHGFDPRGGDCSIVAQAQLVDQVLSELPVIMTELAPALSITGGGHADACVVFRFERVPIRVRARAKPGLWVVRDRDLIDSSREDRQAAGRIRMKAHAGRLVH